MRYDASRPPLRRRLTVSLEGKAYGDARIVDTYANSRVRRAFNSDNLVVEKQQPQDRPAQPATSVSASLAASRLPEALTTERQP